MSEFERAQLARVQAMLQPYKRIALDSVFDGRGRFVVMNKDNGAWYVMSPDAVARALTIKQSDPDKTMLRSIFQDVLRLDEARYNQVKNSLVPRDSVESWQIVQRRSDPKPVARKDLFGLYAKPSRPSYAIVVRFALDPRSGKHFKLVDVVPLPRQVSQKVPQQLPQPQEQQLKQTERPVQALAHEEERLSFKDEPEELEQVRKASEARGRSPFLREVVKASRTTRPIDFGEDEREATLPARALSLITPMSEFGNVAEEMAKKSMTPRFEDVPPRSPPKWLGVVPGEQVAPRSARQARTLEFAQEVIPEVIPAVSQRSGDPWQNVERVPYGGDVLSMAASPVKPRSTPSFKPSSARLGFNPSPDRRQRDGIPAAPLAPPPPTPPPPPPLTRKLPQRLRKQVPEPEIHTSDLGEWSERKESNNQPGRQVVDFGMLSDARNNLRPTKARSPTVPRGDVDFLKANLQKKFGAYQKSPVKPETPSGFTSPH